MSNQSLSTIESSYTKFMEFLILSKHAVFERAARQGLTGMQAVTVCLMDKPYRMSSLSKLFNCDPSNITGLIDGLEQKSMAIRYSDPSDRRIKMVKLSPRGRRIRTQLVADICGQNGFFLKNLSPKEAYQFTLLINKITLNQLD